MSILTIVSYAIRPERAAAFENALEAVARRAAEDSHGLRWTTGQVICGELGRYLISMRSESVAEAARRPSALSLLGKLFEADEAERMLTALAQSIREGRTQLLRQRPELGYNPDPRTEPPTAWVVLRGLMRRGNQEAAEALLSQAAEAIPRIEDPRRYEVWQPVIGNLLEIYALRPIFDLAELDTIESLSLLLQKAFGKSYGTKVHRNGMASFDETETTLVAYREDLSHRGSGTLLGGM